MTQQKLGKWLGIIAVLLIFVWIVVAALFPRYPWVLQKPASLIHPISPADAEQPTTTLKVRVIPLRPLPNESRDRPFTPADVQLLLR